MTYSDKNRAMFAGEIEEIKGKGLYKEKRFICSPQDANMDAVAIEAAVFLKNSRLVNDMSIPPWNWNLKTFRARFVFRLQKNEPPAAHW